ncbi:MAG: penicillin-binding protein activator LpoB [Planctomycetes bacterium]|nr:penicillin-binding protein activator LpoB [Planctomycetota bacterium]
MHHIGVLAGACAAALLAGCIDTARMKSPGEPGLVDQKKAGTVTYDIVVKEAVEKLLAKHHSKVVDGGQGKFWVAFIGIDNKSAEEMGDHEAAVYQRIGEVLVNAGYYRSISMRFINTAKRAAGLADPEELFLREPRERFISVLQKEGQTPDYFIWGVLTSQTSKHSGVFTKTKERRYRFDMEMVDAHTGEIVSQESHEVDKEYVDW